MFPRDLMKSVSSAPGLREPVQPPRPYMARGAEPDRYSLPRYWLIVRRRRELFIGGAVLGAAAAFVALLMSDPVYRATTTIELQGLNESFMGMSSVDPLAGTGEYATSPVTINTQIRIIESAKVRRPVADRLRRESAPSPKRARGALAALRTGLRGPGNPALVAVRALASAERSLQAKAAWNTRIISISAESTIPETAAAFANGVAAEYILQNSIRRAENSRRISEWLAAQVVETRSRLEEAEDRLHAATGAAGQTNAGGAEEPNFAADRDLQSTLAGAQNERLRAQADYELAKATPADWLPNVLQDQTLREYETKLDDLKQQKAHLLLTLMPAHYKVRAIQQRIDELTAGLERERQNVLERARGAYEAALRREQLLAQAWQTHSAAIGAQAGKNRSRDVLGRQAATYRETLNTLLQQASQAAVISAIPANNIRVIDAAAVPDSPLRPDALLYEFCGIVGGIAASIGLAMLFEAVSTWRRNATFGSPGYSSRLLNVPELGVIPSIAVQRRLESPQRRKLWSVPEPFRKDSGDVVIAAGQPSLVAESFRLTLTSLVLMSRRGTQPRIIVVTSPGPGEGKTTVVSNMAIASAEAGRRVLVIDADLRRSRLHEIFQVENSHGLCEAVGDGRGAGLAKTGPWICESDTPGLFVMTAGSIEADKLSQIFHAPEVPALLNKLSSQFDIILIDTPPMLQFSDARLMARYADGVVLVVRSGKTDRDSALAARAQLEQDHIGVIGSVLNDWDARGAEGRSLHSYYKAYLQYQKAAAAGQ